MPAQRRLQSRGSGRAKVQARRAKRWSPTKEEASSVQPRGSPAMRMRAFGLLHFGAERAPKRIGWRCGRWAPRRRMTQNYFLNREHFPRCARREVPRRSSVQPRRTTQASAYASISRHFAMRRVRGQFGPSLGHRRTRGETPVRRCQRDKCSLYGKYFSDPLHVSCTGRTFVVARAGSKVPGAPMPRLGGCDRERGHGAEGVARPSLFFTGAVPRVISCRARFRSAFARARSDRSPRTRGGHPSRRRVRSAFRA